MNNLINSRLHKLTPLLSGIFLLLLNAYLVFRAFDDRLGGAWSFVFKPYALVSMMPVVISLYLLLYIGFSKRRRASVFWLAAVIILILGLNVTYMLQVFSATPEQAVLFQNLLVIYWAPVFPLMLLFCRSYVEQNDRSSSLLLWLVVMLAVGFTAYANGFSNLIVPINPTESRLFFDGYWVEGGPLAEIVYMTVFIFALLSVFTLAYGYRHSSSTTVKKQIRIMLYGMVAFIVPSVILDLAMPSFISLSDPIWRYVPFSPPYSTTIMVTFISYAIFKYQVLSINPAALSETVLKNLTEGVIAINTNLSIEYANHQIETALGYKDGALIGRTIQSLVSEDAFTDMSMFMNAERTDVEFRNIIFKNDESETKSYDMVIDTLHDEEGTLAGYVLIISIPKKRQQIVYDTDKVAAA